MNGGISVVGIGGSLSAQSSSLAALKIAIEGAAEASARKRSLRNAQRMRPEST